MAWRFNRSRIFFSSLLFFLVYIALLMSSELSGTAQLWVYLLVSLILPVNVLVLGLLKERGIFTQHGLVRFAIFAIQGLFAWWLVNQNNTHWLESVNTTWFDIVAINVTDSGISQIAWLAVFGVAIWLLARMMIHQKLMECATLASLALLTLAISQFVDSNSMLLFFGLSGLLLLVTLVQDSYGMAYIDELTELPGRRALMNTLMSVGKFYTIAMIDIDHFKKFNDTHGHDVGDQVLRKVAAQIGRVGGGGRAARYGGEEFTIVFPGKERKEAIEYLEVVRQNIENDLFTIRGKNRPRKAPTTSGKPRKPSTKKVRVTVSMGVAETNDKLTTTDEVMKAADKALYRAKRKGRNQISK